MQVPKIEDQNNISINAFGNENKIKFISKSGWNNAWCITDNGWW